MAVADTPARAAEKMKVKRVTRRGVSWRALIDALTWPYREKSPPKIVLRSHQTLLTCRDILLQPGFARLMETLHAGEPLLRQFDKNTPAIALIPDAFGKSGRNQITNAPQGCGCGHARGDAQA